MVSNSDLSRKRHQQITWSQVYLMLHHYLNISEEVWRELKKHPLRLGHGSPTTLFYTNAKS
ncbi:hypothetical protein M8C21_025715, partial [Ambrosia artemisiifolia]